MFYQVRRLCARQQVGRLAQRRGYGMGTRTCPSCGRGLPTALPVCGACRYVGRVEDSVTHHELLGLPYGPNPFVVDTKELKRRFLEAQRLCHPDGWATRSEADRNAAQAVSNVVNTAYKTLNSPMERIGYVLQRNGKEVGEAEQLDDLELIAEVMEVREAVEHSRGAALERLKSANEDKIRATVVDIERAVGEEAWGRVKELAVRLKYLKSIEEAIVGNAEMY